MARGKVQGVMFRKTLILGAQKRGLKAGATNDPKDENCVHFSVDGEESSIKNLLASMMLLPTLNSWGAKPEHLIPADDFISLEDHQVTTENINQLEFTSGVEFYL